MMEKSALQADLLHKVRNANLFVVGAGGIGCELLKNLVLTGFRNIEVIDLDTIDVSNLNRQFLFQKCHVGRPKVKVAADSCRRLCADVNMITYHDSIFNPEFNQNFFKRFDIVLNALDNRSARSHVNKMCLAASIPMIESASEGYLGQVTVIKKSRTECFDCTPKPRQRTFPGCTIRNTPSEMIHCVVWAKHLFNQLFGAADADEDVSPDIADPELAGGENSKEDFNKAVGDGASNIQNEIKNTRKWAQETDYNSEKIFNKLFNTDIKYLLSMEKLWEKRKPPQPVSWNPAELLPNGSENDANIDPTHHILSIQENMMLFSESIQALKQLLSAQGEDGTLVWDKDEEAPMKFVATAANIRAHIFHISCKSNFEIKSMAGNIVPAIATTNAIVAGLIVMQALNVINDHLDECKTVYVCRNPNANKKLLIPNTLEPPNPKCYVCTENPEILIKINTNVTTVEQFRDKVLKERMGMRAPDVRCLDGLGTLMMISSEEGELDHNLPKKLSELKIIDGSRLHADDFLQTYEIIVNIAHSDEVDTEKVFEVVSEATNIGPKEDQPTNQNDETVTQTTNQVSEEDDDDLIMVSEENNDVEKEQESKKRRASNEDENNNASIAKKPKLSPIQIADEDDDLVLIQD